MLADGLFTGPLSGYRHLRCGTFEVAPLPNVIDYYGSGHIRCMIAS